MMLTGQTGGSITNTSRRRPASQPTLFDKETAQHESKANGILFALLLLGEVPSVRKIIGAAVIVGVVIIAQRPAQQ